MPYANPAGPIPVPRSRAPGLLFVMNFGPGTGYAWATIQEVFQRVGERLSGSGMRPMAAFPPPCPVSTSPFRPPFETIEFDYRRTKGLSGLAGFCRLLREQNVKLLYLTDHPTASWRFVWYRLAGVRRIVIHDRTSGDRHPTRPLVQPLKALMHRIRIVSGDLFIGVSDFVARRLVAVNRTPPNRTVRVYNGIPLERFQGGSGHSLQLALGLPPETRVVFASGRANAYKGIPTLLEAWRKIEAAGYTDVHAAFAGDGPGLPAFRRQAEGLGLMRFHFLGRRDDIPALLASSTVVVVPSQWAEAFGLTVVEGMAAGRPVIASAVGGIPELITSGKDGLLFSPGDQVALAEAICRCLDRGDMASALGRAARETVTARFSIDRAVEDLAASLQILTRG